MSFAPNELTSSMTRWKSLSEQAAAGVLEIPEGVAFECDEVCAAYIRHLQEMVQKTRQLVDIESFGDFESSRKLGEKFEKISYSGDRSLRVVLLHHIEVIELMRSVFRHYFDEAEYADRRTSKSIEEFAR